MAVRTDPISLTRSPRARFVSDQVPLYYQLQSILTDKILSGEFPTGGRIPTEVELGEEYGVSRITVRQALRGLEEKGLIRREAGRGTFVNEHHSIEETLKLEGSLDDLISFSTATSVQVLKLTKVKANAAEAALLGLPAGSLLIRCARLRFHHDQPYCHVVNDLPLEIGRRFSRSDWKGLVSRVLEKKLGIPLREAQQTVRASLADAELARLLRTHMGAPLLSVDRIVLTDHRRPVERVRTHYRSDIFSFTVHLGKDHLHEKWGFRKGQRSS